MEQSGAAGLVGTTRKGQLPACNRVLRWCLEGDSSCTRLYARAHLDNGAVFAFKSQHVPR